MLTLKLYVMESKDWTCVFSQKSEVKCILLILDYGNTSVLLILLTKYYTFKYVIDNIQKLGLGKVCM